MSESEGSRIPGEQTALVRLRNDSAEETILLLEPWGESYSMEPTSSLEIVAIGPIGYCLEVAFSTNRIVVYGWPGSVIKIFSKLGELGAGKRERSPAPSGPSAKGESHDDG